LDISGTEVEEMTKALASEIDPSPIFDPLTYEHGVPYSLLARLRRESPIVWVEEPPVLGWPGGPGFWAVLRHRDVKEVLKDHQRFSSAMGGTQIRDYETESDLSEVRKQILNMDPPEHDRLRKLMARAFTPKAVATLEAKIEQKAASLVEQMRERGRFDFVAIVSELPLYVLAEVLGVPESDRYLMYDWSNRVIGYQDPEYSKSARFDPSQGTPMARRAFALRPSPGPDGKLPNPRTRAGVPDLYSYAGEMARFKREHPGEDVMSILLGLRGSGGPVSNEEFENLFWLFAVAGNETLRNAIPGGMSTLLDHMDQYLKLKENPSLLITAVEEMLRYWPPVMHFRRTATVETEVAGQHIGKGDKVVVWHASANRDETVFNDPDRFDITRSPNDHVSFGFGVHFCLGAHLARAQMRAIFSHIISDLPVLERDGQQVRLISNFQNGLKHLPVRLS
jgi:cytochrome P450